MDTNFCYGEVPATLREKYYEAHDLIIKAWAEDRVFSFNGKYTKLRYVNLWPKPLQRPHPPIWIPGGGSLETWDFCADHGHQFHVARLRMEATVLDAHLAHPPAGELLAVDLHGDGKMLVERVALIVDRRRCDGFTLE